MHQPFSHPRTRYTCDVWNQMFPSQWCTIPSRVQWFGFIINRRTCATRPAIRVIDEQRLEYPVSCRKGRIAQSAYVVRDATRTRRLNKRRPMKRKYKKKRKYRINGSIIGCESFPTSLSEPFTKVASGFVNAGGGCFVIALKRISTSSSSLNFSRSYWRVGWRPRCTPYERNDECGLVHVHARCGRPGK